MTLVICNAAVQRVRTLVDETQRPRPEGYAVEWNGKNDLGADVSSGVYFCRLSAGDFSATQKVVLLK